MSVSMEELLKVKRSWLVTGAAGFIGSNLVEKLLEYGQTVIGLDNFSTGYRHNLEELKASLSGDKWKNFTFIEGDVVDYDTCVKATENIDFVLHQAALGSVPRSIDDPLASNNTNVTGFLNMLTASKSNGVKRFVFASSSSVYGDSEELPKVESRIGKPLSPYAVTKYTNELYAEVFYRTYGFETIGLRYFNVFGKRQDPNGAYAAVIPKWISQMLRGEEVYINGDGETSRDFTYIDNVVQANILAALTQDQRASGISINIAAGGRETLNNLFVLLKNSIEAKISHIKIGEPKYRDFRPGDVRHSNANIALAKEVLDYEPMYTLEEGLEQSIDWYINNITGEKK